MKSRFSIEKNTTKAIAGGVLGVAGVYIVLKMIPQVFLAALFLAIAYFIFPFKKEIRRIFEDLFGGKRGN